MDQYILIAVEKLKPRFHISRGLRLERFQCIMNVRTSIYQFEIYRLNTKAQQPIRR